MTSDSDSIKNVLEYYGCTDIKIKIDEKDPSLYIIEVKVPTPIPRMVLELSVQNIINKEREIL